MKEWTGQAPHGAFFTGACVSLFIVILIILLLFGSGSLPKIGQRLGEKSRKPVRQARWVMAWATGTEEDALEAERDYGRECTRDFVAQFPGEVSERDRELVESIGGKLAAAVKDRRRRFSFSPVPGPAANAYALPGGFVFITAPLLELCGRDPDEIAFFLAHEVGHVVCGHARDQLRPVHAAAATDRRTDTQLDARAKGPVVARQRLPR